jgi:hypothetical protein
VTDIRGSGRCLACSTALGQAIAFHAALGTQRGSGWLSHCGARSLPRDPPRLRSVPGPHPASRASFCLFRSLGGSCPCHAQGRELFGQICHACNECLGKPRLAPTPSAAKSCILT